MNVYEIEALVRAAETLRNYERNSKGEQVHNQILDRVAAELGKVETADEVAKLQHSSNIKRENLNLLAGKTVALIKSMNGAVISGGPASLYEAICELEDLAKSLIQEEPDASAAG